MMQTTEYKGPTDGTEQPQPYPTPQPQPEPSPPPYDTNSPLAAWAGPYVTDMLGKSWALSQGPYQAYQGPLTAGATGNQMSAFQGVAGLAVPDIVGQSATNLQNVGAEMGDLNYDPTQFTSQYTAPTDMYQAGDISTGRFDTAAAQQYMNPYLQSALDPMMQEARRQAEISRLSDASRLTQAGAFGGSRQAIMESEMNRNLMDKQNQMLTQGYQQAFDRAMQGFQTDEQRALEAQIAQERAREAQGTQALTGAADAARYGLAADELGEQSRQFGAGYGLDALTSRIAAEQAAGDMGLQDLASQMDIYNQMYDMGSAERGIDQERIAADYAQFQQERDYPYEQLQFMQSMLQGLPISSRETANDENILAQILGGAGGLGELFGDLFGQGEGTTP
jgi:hypothetical protein